MHLLQRYILSELLKVFASVLSVLTVLLMFVGVFQQATESGLGPEQVLQIIHYVVPSLMPFTIPATLLLTVCVVYGRIAGDQEVTAAKAAGINVFSLLWPSFLLGLVLSACSLLLADRVNPWAMANIESTKASLMEDIFLDYLGTNHNYRDKEHGYSITVKGVVGKKLILPTFQYAPGDRSPFTLTADEAYFQFDLEKREVVLHLKHVHVDAPNQSKGDFAYDVQRFPLPDEMKEVKPRYQSIENIRDKIAEVQGEIRTQHLRRDINVALALAHGDFDRLLAPELDEFEAIAEDKEEDLAKFETEIHSRFALSTSCIFFVLIGAPFSILQAKRQFLTSFFICFLPILLIYYPVVLLTMNLCKSGHIQPIWAMWVGNAILLVVGTSILRRVLKH